MRKWLSFFAVGLLVLPLCLPANAEDLNILVAQEETEESLEDQGEALSGVFIKNIIIEGNTVIDTETLNKVIESFKDRELTLEEMSEMTDLLTMTYQEKGYILARAYLPEQEIQDGILKVTIAEGKIGKITVSGYTHYKANVIKRYFEQQQKHGIIKESLLEKGLLLSTDMQDVKTTVVLREGAKPGEVDVILDTKDTSTVTFGVNMRVDYNNFGSDIVGEDRLGVAIGITDHYWGSKFDLRAVSGTIPEDSLLESIKWTVPINSYGSKIQLGYLHSNYVVGQALADLGMQGRTEFYSASFSHPVMKEKNKNLNLRFGWTDKFNKNIILQQARSLDKEDVYDVTLNYDSLDRFLGKNIASLSYQWGKVKRDESLATSRENTEDKFFDKWVLNLARIQKVYGYTNIMLRGAAQITDKRLLTIEQTGLGGYGSVRGYDPSLYLGDQGYNVSAELMFAPPFLAEKTIFGQRLAQLVQFALFADHGQVWTVNADANDDIGDRHLTGYGGGLRLYYKDWFTFKYDLGIPKNHIEGKKERFHYFQTSFTLF
ncbi:MAG: ShlB/FhaC/HecB family hemolysin secretion/activation protein [Candidatus Desulfatibia sp.]|uniref:ShlB/FhaC/HecB family hemolysin secretion/activation protein n=1 Tax=Candidatus Desulfatibia sp. TaxID=3101189 RepID=UPI002F2D5BE8